ncbi:DUF2268 domain-containing putative Zn-dependent protease [Bacillus sp. es.034]|uniref:DUF2268 domain-containing protein n=1 Tax=Bacillus sp. es.034 TaxID=1761763 RepID=UPI000C01DBC3|nr:DUF2268 domain-containing putative Zn-dependent protease [Bacillus sp. es.034]PFG03519.1 uncharacterized protein YjaZ [Bacillus sp. es.034]
MKTVGKVLLILALCFMFMGCSNKEPVDKKEQETPITFSHEEQNFEIIYMYDEVQEYVDTVRGKSGKSNETVFIEKVFEPFKKKSNMEEISLRYTFDPSSEVDKLGESVKELEKEKDTTSGIIKEALLKSAKELHGKDKKYIIFPANPEDTFIVEQMGGVSGFALSEDVIVLQLSPSVQEDILKYTVAHEYNHLIAEESNRGMIRTILGGVVLEGKADAFAHTIYPKIQAPWQKPMTPEEKERVIAEITELRYSDDMKYYEKLRKGNSSKGIPQWANYKIGYEIVQSYRKNHPEISIGRWTSMHEAEIIAGSDFKKITAYE